MTPRATLQTFKNADFVLEVVEDEDFPEPVTT